MATLNPAIEEVQIGVRQLRNITIYPLSVAHQLKVKKMVVKFMALLDNKPDIQLPNLLDEEMEDLVAKEELDEGMAFIEEMVEIVSESIEELLTLVTDPKDNVTLEDVTNDQYADIIVIVVRNNFEAPGKKLKKVVQEVKNLFLSKK